MITAILFDLDHTLSDRETAFHNFAVSQYRRFRKALGAVTESDYVSTLIATDARGMHAKATVYDEIARQFSLAREKACELHRDFEEGIAKFYVPFAGVHETLMLLRR